MTSKHAWELKEYKKTCFECGKKFEPTHRLRKYCDDCRKDGGLSKIYGRNKINEARRLFSEGKIPDHFVMIAKNSYLYQLRYKKYTQEAVFRRYISKIGCILAMEQYMKELKK